MIRGWDDNLLKLGVMAALSLALGAWLGWKFLLWWKKGKKRGTDPGCPKPQAAGACDSCGASGVCPIADLKLDPKKGGKR